MTIGEAGKGVVVSDTGTQTYRIGFNGNDETELDAKNMSELEELWRGVGWGVGWSDARQTAWITWKGCRK